MGLQEIERKFLVKNEDFKITAERHFEVNQGYLSRDPERNVRVRVTDDKAFLTIKGASSEDGTTRFEWEREIPYQEGRELLKLCIPAIIEKTRYIVKVGHYTYEVDVFSGVNQGLIVAEIELNSADEYFTKPEWLGEEVTGDERYYNSKLSRVPYCIWGNAGLFSAQ